MALPNTVRRENTRVFETVPLGALTAANAAPGAEKAEPTGSVLSGNLTTIFGLSSVANIQVGSEVYDGGQKKFWPNRGEAYVTAVNSAAKTVTVSIPAVFATVSASEEAKTNEGVKIQFINWFTFAGAETLTVPLVSSAYQNSDFTQIVVNVLEGTAAVTLKAQLETSWDGGITWTAVGGETATITEKGKGVAELNFKEKTLGRSFRLALKGSAAGGFAGYAVVATDPTSGVSRAR